MTTWGYLPKLLCWKYGLSCRAQNIFNIRFWKQRLASKSRWKQKEQEWSVLQIRLLSVYVCVLWADHHRTFSKCDGHITFGREMAVIIWESRCAHYNSANIALIYLPLWKVVANLNVAGGISKMEPCKLFTSRVKYLCNFIRPWSPKLRQEWLMGLADIQVQGK